MSEPMSTPEEKVWEITKKYLNAHDSSLSQELDSIERTLVPTLWVVYLKPPRLLIVDIDGERVIFPTS